MSTETRSPLILCPHCATLHKRLPVPAGAAARCVRCDSVLYRGSRLSVQQWRALALSALIVFAIANYFPIVTLRLKWLVANASLPEALRLTWEQGHPVVAVMTGLFGFLIPLTQLLFILWALMCVASGNLPRDFAIGTRVMRVLGTWSMVPVLMLGILVAIVKLADLAVLRVEPGLWGFVALTVLVTMLSRVTVPWLWRQAEEAGLVAVSGADADITRTVAACSVCGHVQNLASPHHHQACRRCGARVKHRLPGMSRTWALVIAACILYIPANVLPVMRFRSPVGMSEHTILGGVVELWKLGSWDLAVIVFIASIVVPMTKLLILIALMLRRCWLGDDIQRQRTRLYELVEFIGQWSMLDVFVVILLTAMANFPGISQISAGPGAASFGLVVVLTMLASAGFDPRRGWDARPPDPAHAHGARQAATPGGPHETATITEHA